jgi:methylated-DNA-protein-cysteine methyltransferase-like protein
VGDFEGDVLAVIRRLRRGEVMTYGEVAAEAGHPGAARAVGNVVARTTEDVPWWRVVGAGGKLVSPHAAEQRLKLVDEGVHLP